MEAIGEDLGGAYDAGNWLPRPAHLHAVPGDRLEQPETVPGSRDVMAEVAVRIAAVALAAPEVLATASYVEAADFAAWAEGLARTVEFLQLVGAGAVDRTRTQAITGAAAKTRTARFSTSGTEAAGETDSEWPRRPSRDGRPVVSPADDGCRNTAEFLRLRLQIPIREARRRLTLSHNILPGTTLTGEPLTPRRPHLAAALVPTLSTDTQTAAGADTGSGTLGGPAVSSYAATIITATLDRLQHRTTGETLDTIEHHLTTAATRCDPDFLTRLAQRWTDTIDADGTEPTEEALRHTQGAFIRKPRHGLHHLEIFATTDQYEHLLTVMNTATNPRTSGNYQPGQTGRIDLDRRTRAQKQLDGIVTAAKTALATNTLPATGGNRPQIIATINYQDLFPQPTAASERSEPSSEARTHTGAERGTVPEFRPRISAGSATGAFMFTGPVAAATLRKIACDADIIPALLGTQGEILDLGRKIRLFTPAQRTALTARDQGCAFPNCTIPAPWCEAHHITYWSRGGPTTTNNGVLLCGHHHHLIHKEQWTITTTHGMPAFIPPPHIDPTQTPQQNDYFKPPPPPTRGNNHRPQPSVRLHA
ncbi:HNH endonuclease signature motif containing protein [Pseudarthrobacter phenanthrenivorans]|uniref:HNH endonuclease signature motif containing protein n=1 Tax=Pseudarthrobacter phenanthrenivorans TaxID=361575 RepID=UPI002F35E70B